MSPKGATRDQRVTLALKYHYLDGLNAGEIKERFKQEGVGEYARSTIRGYLNDSPKEEVIEQIDKEQANVRKHRALGELSLHGGAGVRGSADTGAGRDDPVRRAT